MRSRKITAETRMSLLNQVIACGDHLAKKGLLTATQGNISLLLPDDQILITRSGADLGKLIRSDILRMTLEGDLRSFRGVPSSETALHLAAYTRFPGIGAVIHAHPPVATTFATAGKVLPRGVLAEIELELGEISLLPWAMPGSRELAATLQLATVEQRALLLSNHGALTLGNDLEQACRRMELLEFYATLVWRAEQLGGVVRLTDEQLSRSPKV